MLHQADGTPFCVDENTIWETLMILRTPPSFTFGYTYQLMGGNLRVRLTHTGRLPDNIKGDHSVNIFAKIHLQGSRTKKKVCIVRSGKPQKSQLVDFFNVSGKTVHDNSLVFTLFFDNGLFKRNNIISKWTAQLVKCRRNSETYDWKEIEMSSREMQ